MQFSVNSNVILGLQNLKICKVTFVSTCISWTYDNNDNNNNDNDNDNDDVVKAFRPFKL